jgi:hypothetical protein
VSAESASSDDIWADDLLGRQADAEFLKQFLVRRIEERSEEGRKKSYVLNLDAGWGHGKTFFLTRFKRQLEAEGYLAVYVNAWEDDHAEDPMIAVMAAIDEAIAPRLKKKKVLTKTWETTKSSFKQIAVTTATHGLKKLGSKYLGEGADIIGDIWANGGEPSHANPAPSPSKASESEGGISDQVAEALSEGVEKLLDRYGEEALSRFRKAKSSSASFKDNLTKFLDNASHYKDIKVPLFVLVDELDRCRPTYAIELLERIKHLFEVDNIVFVVATDSGQLRHAIKAVYGESFESGRYLLRFFDRSYEFEKPSLESFVSSLFARFQIKPSRLSSPPDNEHQDFVLTSMRAFRLSLRDAEQCFDILRTILTTWQHPTPLELVYLLPLIFAYQQGHSRLFQALERCSASEVKEQLDALGIDDWTLHFRARTAAFSRVEAREFGFKNFLFTYLPNIIIPLSKSTDGERQSPDSRWIQERFIAELRMIHNTAYNHNGGPMSVLRKYPEMVRNAGRIVATA